MDIFTYPETARPPSAEEAAMLVLARPLIELAKSRLVDTSTGPHLFFSESTCLTVHPPCLPTPHPAITLLRWLAGRKAPSRRFLWFQPAEGTSCAQPEHVLEWERDGSWVVLRDGAVQDSGRLPHIDSPVWLDLLNEAGVPDPYIPAAWVAARDLLK